MSPLDDTELFELFVESQLRLAVVGWLSTRRGPIGLDDLSRTVADGCELSRDIVELRLHHVHLPKLTQAGLLAYDVQEQTVGEYSPDRLAAVVESFTAAFPRAERTFAGDERPPERGVETADADVGAPSESMHDEGHVEVPPPHGSDEDD